MYKPIHRSKTDGQILRFGANGGRFLPIAVGVVLVMVILMSMLLIWNFYESYQRPETPNVKIILNKSERTCTNEQEDKEIAMARLINHSKSSDSTSSDDDLLIDVIRNHFIDPPSDKLHKMSYHLFKTPQAEKIDRILQRKVCFIRVQTLYTSFTEKTITVVQTRCAQMVLT